MKRVSLFVKTIAIAIIFVSLFNTLINLMIILKWSFPQSFGISTIVNKLSVAFVLEVLFYINLLISGAGILMRKIWGLNLLLALLVCNILYGFIPGIYQDIFSRIIGSHYTVMGKIYIILYLFVRKLFVPILTIILFTLPKIRREFCNKNK